MLPIKFLTKVRIRNITEEYVLCDCTIWISLSKPHCSNFDVIVNRSYNVNYDKEYIENWICNVLGSICGVRMDGQGALTTEEINLEKEKIINVLIDKCIDRAKFIR